MLNKSRYRPTGLFGSMAVALTICVAACGSQRPSEPALPTSVPASNSVRDPSGAPGAGGGVFAYRSPSEIGLVIGTEVVARAPGDFGLGRLSFTEDGKYVFAYSARAGQAALVTINVDTHAIGSINTPTSAVVPGGGSSVIWVQNLDQIASLDLSKGDSQPAVTQKIPLPPINVHNYEIGPSAMAAMGQYVLLERHENPGNGPNSLYLLSRNDNVIHALQTPDGYVPSGQFSPDGKTIAYLVDPEACGHGTVNLVDTAMATTKVLQLPENAAADVRTGVTNYWWNPDDTLQANFTSRQCGETRGRSDPFKTPSIWTLSGNQWQLTDPGPIQEKRTLASSDIAILSADTGGEGSELTVSEHSSATHIADKVFDIAVSPRK